MLRDFSLLNPIKVIQALHPEEFEKEEIIIEQKLILQREQNERKLKKKSMKSVSSIISEPKKSLFSSKQWLL